MLAPSSNRFRPDQLSALSAAFDSNRDGQLSAKELPSLSATQRATLDADGNGRVSRVELEQGLAQDRITLTLTRPEAIKAVLSLDTDQDGTLGRGELDMTFTLMDQLDGFGRNANGANPLQTARDAQGRSRRLDAAVIDGRIALSELVNAFTAGRLTLGARLRGQTAPAAELIARS